MRFPLKAGLIARSYRSVLNAQISVRLFDAGRIIENDRSWRKADIWLVSTKDSGRLWRVMQTIVLDEDLFSRSDDGRLL
ncbi:MAG: hypothetical protein CFE29_06705 [Bradyrhizobiaceae bacterium PARB1]|nr:MAG: hypothetical protein CFE29_06705 [Bradyrhizobiaceae bacterium PARB1]